MGKTSRAIMAGVGAGLTTFGQGMARKIEQDAANERVDARLEKEDAFKERQLKLREDEAGLRMEALKRQATFDKAKLGHAKLVQDVSAAGDNVDMQADAFSKFFPDKRNYSNNPNAAFMMGEKEGREVFAVWDVSFNEEDPTTGEMVPDPQTGNTKQVRSKNGQMIFRTQDEFISWKSKLMNPDLYLAYSAQDITTQMAIKQDTALADARAKTQAGKAVISKTEAEAALATERASLAKRTDPNIRAGAVDRQKSTMQNLPGHPDGKSTKLTTKEMEQRKDDAKSWKEKIEGITAQEVRYIEQGREMFPGWVDKVGQLVVDQGSSKEEVNAAAKTIESKYKVSPTTAKGMLRIAMQDKESNEPGFFGSLVESMFGKSAPTDEQF
jgi:hypothetical protein